jgi:hypothetical protein
MGLYRLSALGAMDGQFRNGFGRIRIKSWF